MGEDGEINREMQTQTQPDLAKSFSCSPTVSTMIAENLRDLIKYVSLLSREEH